MNAPQSPPSAPPSQPPPASIHVDLDGARDIFAGHGWAYTRDDDPIFESGMRNLLDFLATNQIHATLFVIARDLERPRHRALLERAVEDGHEIASHTFHHRYLTRIAAADKREEIVQSKDALERGLQVTVRGFRAPGYRIDIESLDMLAQYGYEYDTSVMPTAVHARAVRTPIHQLREPYLPLPDSPLVEWTLPDHRPWPVPFQPSYSLLLGDWLFRTGVARFRRRAQPLTLLFHLIDFADPLPAASLGGLGRRIFTLSTLDAARKRQRCQAMLDRVRQLYRLVPTLAAIAEWRGGRERNGPRLAHPVSHSYD